MRRLDGLLGPGILQMKELVTGVGLVEEQRVPSIKTCFSGFLTKTVKCVTRANALSNSDGTALGMCHLHGSPIGTLRNVPKVQFVVR